MERSAIREIGFMAEHLPRIALRCIRATCCGLYGHRVRRIPVGLQGPECVGVDC